MADRTESLPRTASDNERFEERLEGTAGEVACLGQGENKAPGEAECPESEWELPEHPSSRLMVEMKLARISKDVQDIANILQNTLDPSLEQYVMEQRPCIQRTVATLQALRGDGPELTTAASVESDIIDSKVGSTPPPPPPPPARTSPVSDCQRRSSSTLEALDPSLEEILWSLEAEVRQQKAHNAVAWNYTRRDLNVFICAR